MENFEEKLEDLIRIKSFEALTLEEKAFVLSHLTEDRYNLVRKTEFLLQEIHSTDDISAAPGILGYLHDKFKETHSKDSFWNQLLGIKIPAYTTALLMLASSAFVYFYETANTKAASVVVRAADTLFVVRKDTIIKEKIILKYASHPMAPVIRKSVSVSSEEKIESPKVSASMKENDDLNDLLVSGS
jgi:hypothetical protein